VVDPAAITRSIADQAPHHPHSGAHDRDHKQDEQDLPSDPSGDGAGARPATLAQKMEMPRGQDPQDSQISKEPISMETPIGDDDDSHLGDFIEDQATLAPNDAAMYASLREVTKDVLDSLTPREAKVLRMRFGIEMNTDHTPGGGRQAVRRHSRARIRQIEAKACAKLRHPSRSERLKSFLDNIDIADGKAAAISARVAADAERSVS